MIEFTNLEIVQLCFFSNYRDARATKAATKKTTALLENQRTTHSFAVNGAPITLREGPATVRGLDYDHDVPGCLVVTRHLHSTDRSTPVYWPNGRVAQ